MKTRYAVYWGSLAAILALATTATGQPVPCRGHYYERVDITGYPSAGITWTEAAIAAESREFLGVQGHLATITSALENNHCLATVLASAPYCDAYWIGGFQDTNAPDYSEPSGGWRWTTGEAWDYTNWAPGEPNNTSPGTEEYLCMYPGCHPDSGSWNDEYDLSLPGYVVEYDTPPCDAEYRNEFDDVNGWNLARGAGGLYNIEDGWAIIEDSPDIGTAYSESAEGQHDLIGPCGSGTRWEWRTRNAGWITGHDPSYGSKSLYFTPTGTSIPADEQDPPENGLYVRQVAHDCDGGDSVFVRTQAWITSGGTVLWQASEDMTLDTSALGENTVFLSQLDISAAGYVIYRVLVDEGSLVSDGVVSAKLESDAALDVGQLYTISLGTSHGHTGFDYVRYFCATCCGKFPTTQVTCDDMSVCTCDEPAGEFCTHAPRAYGDVNCDGAINIFDIFCVLDVVGGDLTDCTTLDADIHPCEGNGAVNVLDAFAVLDAIAGHDPCCGDP